MSPRGLFKTYVDASLIIPCEVLAHINTLSDSEVSEKARFVPVVRHSCSPPGIGSSPDTVALTALRLGRPPAQVSGLPAWSKVEHLWRGGEKKNLLVPAGEGRGEAALQQVRASPRPSTPGGMTLGVSRCNSRRASVCAFTFYSSRAPGRLIQLAPMLRGMSRNFKSFRNGKGLRPHVSGYDRTKRTKDLTGRCKGSAVCVAMSLKGLF